MSTTTSPLPGAGGHRSPAGGAGPARAFLAVLWRDLYVTGRELPVFLAQVVLQPLFLLFVFGKVLTDLGFAQPGYTRILFPGILALTAFVTGPPEHRLPAGHRLQLHQGDRGPAAGPLPVRMVAVEKVVFASLGPAGGAGDAAHRRLDPGLDPVAAQRPALFVTVLLLGCLVGSCLGMIMGTAVPPNRINVMFALVLTPLLFTGASQYPWASLDHLPWFQVVTACNPLTYVSEGMRAPWCPTSPTSSPGSRCWCWS